MDLKFGLDFNAGFSKSTQKKMDPTLTYDLLIVGGGPAGLNAALYAKRKGLDVGILTKRKGGQLLDTSVVDNYLGIREISGEGMVEEFLRHVEELEVPMMEEAEVVEYRRQGELHQVELLSGEVFTGRTLLIATGSQPRHLGVPGEDTYAGKGVAYCAICDAPLFKGKDVFIAGGGNSAVEAAIDVAKVARSVTIVHRSKFRADKILVDQLYENPKITVHLETQILSIFGEKAMKGIQVLDKNTGKERALYADGIFIEIGHIPHVGPFKDAVALNEHGEILVDEKNHTSVPGLFAAGDVTQVPYKQIIIAVSDGAKAALSANDHLNLLPVKKAEAV